MSFETYTTISYVGFNAGTPTSGQFVEIDSDTWTENGIFTFSEISESTEEIVLRDQSRDTTITFDLNTNKMILQFSSFQLVWDVVSMSEAISPIKGLVGQRVIDSSIAVDNLAGTVEVQDIFVFDPRSRTSDDTVSNFGLNDIFVSTVKLFDSNNDGFVSFGANQLLDFQNSFGTVRLSTESGVSIRALEYDGFVEQDGTIYYIYSRPGSDAGTADVDFG